jgi:hypothetical protein
MLFWIQWRIPMKFSKRFCCIKTLRNQIFYCLMARHAKCDVNWSPLHNYDQENWIISPRKPVNKNLQKKLRYSFDECFYDIFFQCNNKKCASCKGHDTRSNCCCDQRRAFARLAHKSISISERWAAKPRAERSTCLPCRNLDLIKNSGAKIITVNYYACKFHISTQFCK